MGRPDKDDTERFATARWWGKQEEPSADEDVGWRLWAYLFYKVNYPEFFEKEEGEGQVKKT